MKVRLITDLGLKGDVKSIEIRYERQNKWQDCIFGLATTI